MAHSTRVFALTVATLVVLDCDVYAQRGRRGQQPQGQSEAAAPLGQGDMRLPGIGDAPGNPAGGRRRTVGAPQPPVEPPPTDPEELPPGFVPPPQPPQCMDLVEPLIPEEHPDLRTNRPSPSELNIWSRMLAHGTLDDPRVLERVLLYQLYGMTWLERDAEGNVDWSRVDDLRAGLLEQLHRNILNRQSTAFQEAANALILQHAPRLLDNQYHVRVQAMVLLVSLREPQNRQQREQRPLEAAGDIFVAQLNDPDQVQPVKLYAILGLQQIAGSPLGFRDVALRARAVQGLMDFLNDEADAHWWLRWRAVMTLGDIGMASINPQRADVIWTLLRLVAEAPAKFEAGLDPQWMVSSEAAATIGRIPTNPDLNYSLLSYEVLRMTEAMGHAYRDDPEQHHWQACFYNVYRFYHGSAEDGGGIMAAIERPPASGHAASVQDGWQACVPLLRDVLVEPPDDPTELAASLDTLHQWLEQNPVDQRELWPRGEAFEYEVHAADGQSQQTATTAADAS